ncbi:unnamed protein product [Dibothriocephalus latus]|uniref:Dynein light chain n=1 Tax=Dibothriocephalus latus TaxID=60516 RepID=A0A3P6TUA0_DIBLA|nr:unnamed protein product [Dibothriocephalus latus]
MNGTRTYFGDDQDPMPNILIVEKTDVKTADRENIKRIIQSNLQNMTAGGDASLAQAIKDGLDNEMGSKYWHCIVGKDFAW